jgi:Thaumarchaeal output domain 1
MINTKNEILPANLTVHEGRTTSETWCEGLPQTSHPKPVEPASAEQQRLRQAPRFKLERPLVAIPMRLDGSPDCENRRLGRSLDLGVEGMGLVLDEAVELKMVDMLLVVDIPDGPPAAVGVEVCDSQRTPEGGLRLGTRFGGFGQDLLKPENLTPYLDQSSLKFDIKLPEELLESWANIGVLTPVLWDRVQVCPRCQGLPRFRRGCLSCGSVHIRNDRLIHHFACAHVGPISDFEQDGELVCPKCRTKQLIVAADFEFATGPFRCQECDWTATELEQVAQCLCCDLRFPCHQAVELELKGYRAHRLDPLALLPSPGPTSFVSRHALADGRAPLCPE